MHMIDTSEVSIKRPCHVDVQSNRKSGLGHVMWEICIKTCLGRNPVFLQGNYSYCPGRLRSEAEEPSRLFEEFKSIIALGEIRF